jgi:hypothetical protein
MLSFTAEVFFSLLGQYNRAIWPAQIPAALLGLAAVLLAGRPGAGSGRAVAAILAAAWLWVAIAFHGAYFATISFTAPVVAACFAAQGLLLLWSGLVRGRLRFGVHRHLVGRVGLGLALFGLVLYPLLGLLAHGWRQLGLFGLAPCPTAIVTIGLLLLVEGRTPLTLMVVPALWSIAAGLAAWFLAIPEMLVLPAIGVGGLACALGKGRVRLSS